MKYSLDKSRMGMLIFLGVVVVALWLIVAYGFYKESERVKYDVRVSPGAVSYGTHSTALMPVTVSPMHKGGIPMLSGAAIRSYAHGGHAVMPSLSGKGGVYTTSSAKVKSLGSGMGSGGIVTTSHSSSNRTSRGISYGGGSVAIPSLAVVPSSSISRATASIGPTGRRKAKPGDSGDYDGEWRWGGDSSDDWWVYDEEANDWNHVKEGDTRPAAGGIDVWQDGAWVYYADGDYNPPVPVGPLPWLFMMLLAILYSVKIVRKSH